MNKTAIIFLTILTTLVSACSWVDDDYSDCPEGSWLKIIYSYNMLGVDAAITQIKDVSIFIYDDKGKYIFKEEVGSLDLQKNNYRVKLPSLPDGEYNILVWSGLKDNNLYSYEDSFLTVKTNADGEQNEQLSSLFYGRLDKVIIDNNYRVYEVSLVKDTKTISCLIQNQSKEPLVESDFRLEIEASNARIDINNVPTPGLPVIYLPYMVEVNDLEDVQTMLLGINTLRLMENDNSRLRLIYVPENRMLVDIPLSTYLLQSRLVDENEKNMTPQEYLDRQDRYNLYFFLTESPNPNQAFQLVNFRINAWIVRLQDAELED